MKKMILLILLAFILTSCSSDNIVKEIQKQDFYINTTPFSGFTKDAILKKSGRIISSQNIQLRSTANGRVKDILVRDGDSVIDGQIIALLDDSVTNYGLGLDRAENLLNRAKISYDSNKISLDKTVFDADQNLKRLKNSLKALIDDSVENIKKAETDLKSTDINTEDSKSSLEIKKIENSIIKAELDFDNKVLADTETLYSFYSTVKKEYNSMIILLDDIIEFSDTLYGVTKLNEEVNNNIDTFLGAKDTSQKNEVKILIKELISFNNTNFSNININEIENSDDLLKTLSLINTGYNKTKILLNEIEKTLNNSIDSSTSLSLMDISNYTTAVNVYQGSLQGNYTGFLIFQNGVNTFLRTYKNNQLSIKKSIELMNKDLEIIKKSINISSTIAEVSFNKTIINTNDAISSMETQVTLAENTLLNAKEIRNIYLRSIENQINEAKINYKAAISEFEKLTITSPINGIISSINIDLGQEINIGTPTFSIVNNAESEVNISFNRDELNKVKEGDIVYVIDEDKSYTGAIYSLSQTADENLKYKSVITINEGINLIGNIVSVDIPVVLDNILVPLDIIKIKDANLGTMNVLKQITGTGSDGNKNRLTIDQLEVSIGEIYIDKIEITSLVDGFEKIILNYVDNFDKEKFQLRMR